MTAFPRPLPAALAILAALSFGPTGAMAHFQELIPSSDIVTEAQDRSITLDLVFTHPMEGGPVMHMGEPARFGVLAGGKAVDLKPTLKPLSVDGRTTYRASYTLAEPGDHTFFVAPAPYWEPAEDKYIVHYTKVTVNFAAGDGWTDLVGLPVEIEPLVRPYGIWTGNLFRGVVRRNGAPVPFAEVEVEWRNDGSVTPPSDPFVTQVVKADASGVFAYAMPRAGWWGFAALVEGDRPMTAPDGRPVPVEEGALIWVRAVDMK